MPAWSLRSRVVVVAALACLATMAAGSVAMYKALSLEDEDMLDARLVALGSVVLSFAQHEIAEVRDAGRLDPVHVESENSFGTLYRYQIWSKAGQLLLRSGNAPTAAFGAVSTQGFRDIVLGGEKFRQLTLPSTDGALVLEIVECLDERESSVAMVSLRFLAFLSLPFVLIAFSARRQLMEPLDALSNISRQVQLRGPLDLAPIEGKESTPELDTMLLAINGLFQRVERCLTAERHFASLAAHEMRSPLSGLRARAQLAMNTRDRGEVSQALVEIIRAVDDAAHVMDQLLDFAMIDEMLAQGTTAPTTRVDLGSIVTTTVQQIASRHTARAISIATDLPAGSTVLAGHEAGLTLLVRNLLDNAARYAPAGGQVRVALTGAATSGLLLSFDDSGPGIAPADRAAAFGRFNRLGRSNDGGAGLGLSIVDAAAQMHGATVALSDSELGGLRVTVRFPAAAPDGGQA